MAIESDKQRSLYGDEITRIAFSIFENKGIFALLLGSGLSRAASIPTGWEITLDLIRRVALAKGVTEQLDWGRWYEGETKRTPHYSEIIEKLASSPDERRAILQGYIEPSQEDLESGKKMPTKAHYAIAELVRTWSSSFVGVSSDFEDLFGRFELLGSLADLGGHTEAEVTAELQRSTREAVRISVGRLGWNSERRSRLLAELKSPEQMPNLLKAGFANGSPTFLDLLDKNIQRISSMMGWWH